MRSLRIISLLVAVTLSGVLTMAQQVPYGINYQAVARDSYGNELTSEQIDIRFTVFSGTPQGDIQYQEVHYEVSTSRYGVFSVIIGSGTPIMGLCESFSGISWESAPHYLMVEIKFDNEYLDMGTMQFLSVPYALYAGKSLEPGPEGPPGPKGDKGEPGDPASDDQTISFDGENLTISGGNTVSMSPLVNDADADPENEIQYLSIAGDSLSITDGNSIKLQEINIDDADADPGNEIQDLRIENDQLRITGNADPSLIDLSTYLDNTDSQQLVFNEADSTITIDNGNSINLAGVLRDEDTDQFNEIQDLNLTGNILTITRNTGSAEIDLSPYLDNTDNQQLAYDDVNHVLTITNGTNSVDLDELKNDADADPTNELVTGLAIDGSDLVLNEGVNEQRVDLSSNVIAFRALKETSTTGLAGLTDYDFIADAQVYNDGGAYNINTGEFTAPLNGIYTFNVGYTATGSGDSRKLYVYYNDGTGYSLFETLQTGIAGGMSFLKSFSMKLEAGDSIKILFNTGVSTESGTGSFSGFKVY